jgi:hypothetical protein
MGVSYSFHSSVYVYSIAQSYLHPFYVPISRYERVAVEKVNIILVHQQSNIIL